MHRYALGRRLNSSSQSSSIQIDDVGKALFRQRFGEGPDAAMVCEQQDLVGLAELGEQVERGPAALIIEMLLISTES